MTIADLYADMRDKFGFNDGGDVPAGMYDVRDALVDFLVMKGAPAEKYDRPGMHNSCMILYPPADQDHEPDNIGELLELAETILGPIVISASLFGGGPLPRRKGLMYLTSKALIWLEDDEPTGKADCGCALHRKYQPGDGSAWNDPAVILCPMHDNAAGLLAAAKQVLADFADTNPKELEFSAMKALAREVAKAVQE